MVGLRVQLGKYVSAVCVFSLCWVSVASAGMLGMTVGPPVALDQLLGPNGGSIQVGDKLFDDFAYSWTGDMPTPDRVNVTPYVDAAGNNGIQFSGGFQDLPGGGASDAVVSYSVWVVNPDPRVLISDVHLEAQMSAAGGPGIVLITESFPGTNPEQLVAYWESPPGAGVTSDWADLTNPVRHLRVDKDILINALGQSGIAATTIFTQTFSQTVPEPTSLVLFAVLGSCVCSLRYKR